MHIIQFHTNSLALCYIGSAWIVMDNIFSVLCFWQSAFLLLLFVILVQNNCASAKISQDLTIWWNKFPWSLSGIWRYNIILPSWPTFGCRFSSPILFLVVDRSWSPSFSFSFILASFLLYYGCSRELLEAKIFSVEIDLLGRQVSIFFLSFFALPFFSLLGRMFHIYRFLAVQFFYFDCARD